MTLLELAQLAVLDEVAQGADEITRSRLAATVRATEEGEAFQTAVCRLLGGSRDAWEAAAQSLARSLSSRPGITSAVASNGFVTFELDGSVILEHATRRMLSEALGVRSVLAGRQQVTDASTPLNVGRFHAGHLRAAFLADCLGQVSLFLGSTNRHQDHVGNCSVEIGAALLLASRRGVGHGARPAAFTDLLHASSGELKADAEFAAGARRQVRDLQAGVAEPSIKRLADTLSDNYRRERGSLFDALGLDRLSTAFILESTLLHEVPLAVHELQTLSVTDPRGAVTITSRTQRTRCGPVRLTLVKSDGLFGYDSFDVALLRRRLREKGTNTILTVVSGAQAKRMELVRHAAQSVGWLGSGDDFVVVDHAPVAGPSTDGARRPPLPALELVKGVAAELERSTEHSNPVKRASGVWRFALDAVRFHMLQHDRRHALIVAPESVITSAFALRRLQASASGHARALDSDRTISPALGLGPVACACIIEADRFESVLVKTLEQAEPAILARYLMSLAKRADRLSVDSEPWGSGERTAAALAAATLSAGLGILGISS